MLDDLGDECFVPSPNFSSDPFQQVNEAAVHPVLPEHTRACTERRGVCFDQTESSMDRPENEKNDEEMVSIPKSLEVLALKPLD